MPVSAADPAAMPDVAPTAEAPPAPAKKKRGPATPEGKAKSRLNATRHGLRAATFLLPPGEDPAAFTAFTAKILRAYAPEDGAEEELVDAIIAAMWQAIRADRIEAEVLASILPRHQEHGHGSDLIGQPEHRASLQTVFCYQSTAGNAVRRALDCFLKHRKAKRDGLIVAMEEVSGPAESPHPGPPPPLAREGTESEAAVPAAPPGPLLPQAGEGWVGALPANTNAPAPDCTNDFPATPASTTKPEPEPVSAPDGTNDFSGDTRAPEPGPAAKENCTNDFSPPAAPAAPAPPAKKPVTYWRKEPMPAHLKPYRPDRGPGWPW